MQLKIMAILAGVFLLGVVTGITIPTSLSSTGCSRFRVVLEVISIELMVVGMLILVVA